MIARLRRPLMTLVLLAAAATPAHAAADTAALEVPIGTGETLVIEHSPFRFWLRARLRGPVPAVACEPAGRCPPPGELVGSVAADDRGPPVRVPGIDGPLPVEPQLGAAGVSPPIGFVYGSRAEQTFPVSFFQGNRLFGAEAGAVVSAIEVGTVERRGEGRVELELITDAPALSPARLIVTPDSGGSVRLRVVPPPGPVRPVGTMLSLRGYDSLYGLGARKDAFDQTHRERNVWVEQQNASAPWGPDVTGIDPTGTTGPEYTFPNGDQAAYYVQNALFGSRGWAAWVAQTELARLDLRFGSREEVIRWGVAAPELDLHLAGGGLERASRAYTAERGRAPAPPRYVYEPWIDVINEGEGEAAPNGMGFSGGERVKRDLIEIDRMARKHRIPIGVLGIEGWHEVPGRAGFYARLRRRGYRLSGYWNMFTSPGSAGFAEAARKSLFVETATGDPYPVITNRQGLSYLIDFSHPEASRYWAGQIRRSSRLGLEAFMHDFGELITEGMRFHSGERVASMHNAYPVLYHRAARRALDAYSRRHPQFEPFFYVRAGHSGRAGLPGASAYTPGVFPGDETTDWNRASGLPSVVPTMLNLALTGSYSFTTDVGGYLDLLAPPTTKELFIRWSQLAALTPISRIHNSTMGGSRFPWDYDAQTMRIYRRYARLKMRLIPLVDRWSRRAARNGSIGPVRPMVLEDPGLRATGDQWMLGRRLVVAPIVEQGQSRRRVALPSRGVWRRVVVDRRGRLIPRGPKARGAAEVPVSLRDIPIFARGPGFAKRWR